MTIEKENPEYQVHNYTSAEEGGKLVLRWKYAKGMYFFVFVYDCRRELDLKHIVREMEVQEPDDQTLSQSSGSGPIYTTGDEQVKVFLCRQREFLDKNESYSIGISEFQKEIPYGISVFIGQYDEKSRVMHLYQSRDAESNTRFRPVKLTVKIQYRSCLLSRKKKCILRAECIRDYEDGALQYQVDGWDTPYPLPASCRNSDLFLLIPRNSSVNLSIAKQYRKYYTVLRGE